MIHNDIQEHEPEHEPENENEEHENINQTTDDLAMPEQVTTAVLTELFIFSTAHGNVEIYITVCTCFVKSFFCPLSLHSQFALSPATPKGTNVGAVDVFKGSLQFFCQNGQVLIAVLMNGQIRTQEATTYHAQFGNPPQSPIFFVAEGRLGTWVCS